MKKTIVDLFEGSVKQYPNHTFLWEKTKDKFEPTSYTEVKEQVYTLGAGLMALGVKKGDNIALLSEGRNAWIISELAMFYAGATNVPLSIKLEEANDLLFRLQHADVKFIIVSGNQLKKIRAILDKLPLVQKVIILDEQPQYSEKEISLAKVIESGKVWLKEHTVDEFLTIGKSLTNDDYATITYTSGTTADPKGVILTHRNYTANVEQSLTCVNIDDTWRTLVILPLDHCFAHVVGFYIFMSQGASVATVQVGRSGMETLKNIPINIKEIKPHLILSVPALAKSFKKNIEQGIQAKGDTVKKLFNTGLEIAYTYNGEGGDDRGRGWRFILKPVVALFDKIIFSKVRENFGGELKFFIGGGALLDKELQKFYYAIGLPMYQGYGLSEATPVISTNVPKRHRFGSSGILVQPLNLKICDNDGKELPLGEKGEIVIRGENVMAGYWKNEASTAETIKDGWLYTGDMGYMGKNGLLYVLGRFKSLLIGSDGEKYSPEGIEEALVSHSPSIEQLILYNNQNPYTIALLVPNKEYLKKEVADLASETGKEEAIRIISRDINKFKKGGELYGMFPERWLPATFAVLPEAFTEQNGMVNSTMKVVRGKVEKTYANRIDALYTSEGKDPLNNENKQSL
ncbi:AMP-dependent synthetase/ligase [Massilibacteroides vaginae]|uniref:AMP-dependent synthetase/ligase n=1 Tax=Massilibacteroides vaginae TaxID=1673718 RepID=UPI000A1C9BAB|nr:AMP-binding protein [Massilibacteroides vaginae]